MSAALPVKISNSVLVWARTSIGYTIDEIAHKMNVKPEKINAWENGTASPTYTQLENLAYKVFKRPLAVFFRAEPPKEAPIKKDFRNLTSSEITHLSTEMRLVLRKAKRLQNLVREMNKENETELAYKKFKVSIKDNPVTAANRFREFLGLKIEEQKKWNPNNSFDHFKEYIEKIGVYVFQFQMPFEEARAFSLTDDVPIVVLNTEDAKNGRIFSLFHEVCHILFNIGGVFKDKESNNLKGEYEAIEDFCNRFAVSLLIPEDLFKKDIDFSNQRLQDWSEKDLEKFSRLYSVSNEVILRKLVDLNLASKTFYFTKKKFWDMELRNRKEFILQKQKQKLLEEGRTRGGIPIDIKTVMEKGKPYISKVLDSYEKGRLTYGDVSEYLEVKLDHLPKIIERINK